MNQGNPLSTKPGSQALMGHSVNKYELWIRWGFLIQCLASATWRGHLLAETWDVRWGELPCDQIVMNRATRIPMQTNRSLL